MWQSIVWWHGIENDAVADNVADVQRDTLRLVIASAALAYLAWHFVRSELSSTLAAGQAESLNHWLLVPAVLASLAGSWWLMRRCPAAAPWFFLLSLTATSTAAVWVLASPGVTLLYPLLALVAVVLLHPLAGATISALGLTLLLALHALGPLAWLPRERLVETAVACLLTLGVAWALGRNLVMAVAWSSHSYAEAWRNAQEARANRAELMQALKQLGHAYAAEQRANTALALAWKAADSAERSKTEFVTNISHELRTPLNLIIGFSELILTSPETYQAPLPAAYRGDLNAVYRSAQHLLALTDDVIDLARVGMDRLSLLREPVDLAQIVTDAAAMVRAYVEAKQLTLRLDIAPGLPLLRLDQVRIRQVLLNLLTNAARFTERGGIIVAARGEADALLVRVVDTGAGIPTEDLPRIFDAFYSSGGQRLASGRSLGGFGLGLPLSRRLIELHGGQMGVESQPGRGTSIWFRLPIVATDRPTPAQPGSQARPRPHRGDADPILVLAGTDAAVAPLLRRHLPGYRLVEAPDGARAAALAVELRAAGILAGPDVVLSDGAPVPIVHLPLPVGGLVGRDLAVLACLSKPMRPAQLQATIAALDRPPQRILLVDDDAQYLRLLRRMLQTMAPAAAFRTAHNGQEALAVAGRWRPDLLLLDLVMPEHGGVETLAALRASPTLSSLPVIIVSGQDVLAAGTPLHGALTVIKPEGFVLEELLGAVEGLLAAFRPPRRYLLTSEAPPACPP